MIILHKFRVDLTLELCPHSFGIEDIIENICIELWGSNIYDNWVAGKCTKAITAVYHVCFTSMNLIFSRNATPKQSSEHPSLNQSSLSLCSWWKRKCWYFNRLRLVEIESFSFSSTKLLRPVPSQFLLKYQLALSQDRKSITEFHFSTVLLDAAKNDHSWTGQCATDDTCFCHWITCNAIEIHWYAAFVFSPYNGCVMV